ncbi:MAG: trigger factor [Dorea sp.]|nr:trigger factor [Dorea sp.]
MSGRWKAFSLAIMLGAMSMMTGCQGKATDKIENDYLTITQYKDMEIKLAARAEVTEESVEQEIQNELKASASETEVKDRACQSGDIVYIDYEGKLDGVAFEGGKAENYPLTLGSGTFIPGFEDAVIGHKKGETFDIDVTFPEEYQNADLAGQPTVFTITLHKIVVKEVPEFDDAFVKSVSQTSKTTEEYRTEVKAQLEEAADAQYENDLRNSVWSQVCNNTTLKEYPQDRLDDTTNTLLDTYKQIAESYNAKFEDFVTDYMGYDSEEAFMADLEESAKATLLQTLTMEAIAEKEGLSVNKEDADYAERLEALAEKYNYLSGEDLIKEAGEERVADSLLFEKVMEFVTSNCKLASE